MIYKSKIVSLSALSMMPFGSPRKWTESSLWGNIIVKKKKRKRKRKQV
jgi:hypothetical protein